MKAVTIKQIAHETGLSRNTVSKALNNKYVPKQTLDIVIKKAIELGYKGFSDKNVLQPTLELPQYNLLILLKSSFVSVNFFSAIMRGIDMSKYRQSECINTIPYVIDGLDTYQIQIIDSLIKDKKIDGIICFEFFSDDEIGMVLSSKIPTVFIDSKVFMDHYDGNYDILLAKNYDNIYTLISSLHHTGITSIGFVGDFLHCRGFHERYLACLSAATRLNYSDITPFSILDRESTTTYNDYLWFRQKIEKMQKLPDLFICANDYIALNILQVVQDLDYHVPDDIQIIGFDNIIESEFSKPKLTTVHTPKEVLGREAVDILINRINQKQLSPRTIYINTQILERNSTVP